MLCDDKREERAADGVGFAIQPAVAVFPTVEVVGGEGDEAPLGEFGGKVVVGRLATVDGVPGHAIPPVLADDNGPPFTGLEVFGKQQHSPGNQVVVDIEDHVVGGPGIGFCHQPGTRVEGEERVRKTPYRLFCKHLAIGP